jgi:hypothetical protein
MAIVVEPFPLDRKAMRLADMQQPDTHYMVRNPVDELNALSGRREPFVHGFGFRGGTGVHNSAKS